MSARAAEIQAFLAGHGWSAAARSDLHGDASTRRYLRLRQDGRAAVLMDAPLAEHRAGAFVAVAQLLHGQGLSAPRILAADTERGLLLLEDLGDARMGTLLDDGADPGPLLGRAVDVLIALHSGFDPGQAAATALPRYDAAAFLDQLALFPEVYLPFAGRPVGRQDRADFRSAWADALAQACSAPQSLLLRDYFADNLMWLAERPGVAACGLLDFQDAGIGPVAYDLVSLLEDARRDFPEALRAACTARYLEAFPALDRSQFAAACDVLAALRHVRVLAVFVRLAGGGRPQYLAHLPRLWRLLDRHLEAPALQRVGTWLDARLPADARLPPGCGGAG